MKPIQPPLSNEKLAVFQARDIQKRASSSYRTHNNLLAAKVYQVADILIQPMNNAVYWWLVGTRETPPKSAGEDVYGSRRGAGGVPKKFSTLKAVGWFGLSVVMLPLVILGVVAKQVFHPGRGKDVVRFLDATKTPGFAYTPPTIAENDPIHLATFNVAGLMPMVDAIKDVRPTRERMQEFADWINRQKQEALPIGIGLQEMFDQKGSQIITNSIKERYPYAVTSAGWANIPFVGANSGLQFHSRVPIKSAAFYGFEDLVGWGVKASNRGFLRVELDLGQGRTALVYVTHTQPHTEPQEQTIRKAEIELIQQQMRYDRYQDSLHNIDRGGRYFLMGDLNVANVDDTHAQEPGGGRVDEYDHLHQDGQVLSSKAFYDPYLEEHTPEGERTKGAPSFLEKDVRNEERKARKWKVIKEPEGSFYRGADQKNRLEGGYGTKHFLRGALPAVKNCRFDYVLALQCPEDFKNPSVCPRFTGSAEIRHVLPVQEKTTAVSDHLLISAIFRPVQPIP